MAERKRIHRVLLPELSEGVVLLHGSAAHHLRDVLRVKAGAAIEAFDGAGAVAGGEVSSVDRHAVALILSAPTTSRAEHALELTVAVSLLKGDKLKDVIRQGTELGVARFQLLTSRRSDVRSLPASRLERLRRVAEEAARQSGRARVPQVLDAEPLSKLSWTGVALVADPDGETELAQSLAGSELQGAGAVTVITGPEGGFSTDELADLRERGAVAVTLGPLILRAETAPVALAAVVLLGIVN